MSESPNWFRLPYPQQARIPERKIVDYLLSRTHRSGRSKAAFFGKHGFSSRNWRQLADALRAHAVENPSHRPEDTAYGIRYVVDGPMTAPDGIRLNVRSVWFIQSGDSIAQSATAHPLKRRAE